MKAHSEATPTLPICVIYDATTRSSSEIEKARAVDLAVQDMLIQGSGRSKPTALIIGRYNFSRPERFETIAELLARKNIEIEFVTAHASKGREADFVIVVGLEAGEYGFPAAITDDPVMNMVLSDQDPFLHAEERRLFYVAMTRAKRRAYLIASQTSPSAFVEHDMLGADLTKYVEVLGETSERHRCPRCDGKTILRKQGANGTFWGCANWPLCEGKLERCPHCRDGGLIEPQSGSSRRTFRCTDCPCETAVCPQCGIGAVVERTGRNGPFLACSLWQGGDGCTYTRSI